MIALPVQRVRFSTETRNPRWRDQRRTSFRESPALLRHGWGLFLSPLQITAESPGLSAAARPDVSFAAASPASNGRSPNHAAASGLSFNPLILASHTRLTLSFRCSPCTWQPNNADYCSAGFRTLSPRTEEVQQKCDESASASINQLYAGCS